VGGIRFLELWAIVSVVAPGWSKHALRRKPKNLHVKSQCSTSYSCRDLSVYTETDGHG